MDNKVFDYNEIPRNSLSCFIGRICEDPGEDFMKDGVLWVDVYDLEGDENGPSHGEEGTTQRKAIASWTLRAAYTAWKKPPKIKFKGKLKVNGKVSMGNAKLSNVTLSGGPPMQGTTTCGMGPGTAVVPFSISSASGTAKIEQVQDVQLEVETDGDNLDIELVSQNSAVLPWCVQSEDAEDEYEVDNEGEFIKAGDMALCMAFGNSLSTLYCVDILR